MLSVLSVLSVLSAVLPMPPDADDAAGATTRSELLSWRAAAGRARGQA